MKRFSLIAAASMLLCAACTMQELDTPVGAEGMKVDMTFTIDFPESDPDTKIAFNDSDSTKLAWTGSETMKLVFGKWGSGGADNKTNPTIASTAPGVFSGSVTVPAGFSVSDLQGLVVPGELTSYFDWSSSTAADLRMEIPADQVQVKNGVPEFKYMPFFYDITDKDVVSNGDNSYSLNHNVTLRTASDFIRFNIYGKHPESVEGEVFKSIKIIDIKNGANKDNICGKTAWPINSTGSGVNNTGSNYITVKLEEAVTVDDKTAANGVKVYAAAIFGGSRTVDEIIIETDKARYTKTLSTPHKFPQMNLSKFMVHKIGIDLSNGYTREGIASTTKLALDPDGQRVAMGTTIHDLTGYTLTVDGAERSPYIDSDGNLCIGEVENKDAEALITWENAHTTSLPFSNFYGISPRIPLRGKIDSTGTLVFSDVLEYAVLDINVKGYGDIQSVKVRTLDGSSLATDGVDFSVLNCIRQSGGAVPLQKSFYIPVKPGTYAGGLEVTVCDSKRLMHRFIANVGTLESGDVKKIETTFTPAADLVFYEGFDNCTWGADMTGKNKGFGPDNTTQTDLLWRTSLTGYEEAWVEAAAGTAGSGFQQPDAWSNSSTIASKHTMSTSYVNSRDFMDWKYLYRSQEFQGCIGVGANYKYRGWVETPKLTNLTEASQVKVSFRIMITEGATENLQFAPLGGGSIIGLSIDSVPVLSSGNEVWAGSASHVINSSKLVNGWHDVTYTINGATSATTFQIRGELTSGTILHGFYLDDITVTKVGVAKIEASGISELTTLSTIKASFKVSFEETDVNGLTLNLPSGGYICGLEIDSVPVVDKYGKTAWPSSNAHKVLPSEVGVGEHTLTYTIESADASTTFTFTGDTDRVSDLKVEKVSSITKGNFRLLLWNIQMGMWADQGNNYDNFVAWVNKYDPDCFVITEAETVKKTGSTSNISSSDKYFPNGWSATAKRFNHSYVQNGGNRDNYSQEITSKTPITALAKITDSNVSGKPIQHGAGHFRITVGGKEIDIVTMHTWPQAYAPGASDQTASSAANEGDHYRKFEVEYVINQTVLNPAYASQQYWVVLGDLNSRSRCDNWFYNYPENSTKLIAQDYIRDNTDLIDVIEGKYPGRFIGSTAAGTARIDYVYVSPALFEFLDSAITIRDGWTSATNTGLSNYWYPSDHRPILLDFNF